MKKIYKILGIGIALGILLLIIKSVFQIDEKILLSYYWKIALVFLLLLVVINVLYYVYYMNKLKKIMPLYTKGDSKNYIKEIEKLLKHAKGNAVRTTLKLNLSAAYLEEKSYNNGKKILEEIDIDKIKDKNLNVVYWINTCVANFKLKENKQFKNNYISNKNLFDQFKDNKYYEKSINDLEIMYQILDERIEQADMLIQKSMKKWNDDKSIEGYTELYELIEGDL